MGPQAAPNPGPASAVQRSLCSLVVPSSRLRSRLGGRRALQPDHRHRVREHADAPEAERGRRPLGEARGGDDRRTGRDVERREEAQRAGRDCRPIGERRGLVRGEIERALARRLDVHDRVGDPHVAAVVHFAEHDSIAGLHPPAQRDLRHRLVVVRRDREHVARNDAAGYLRAPEDDAVFIRRRPLRAAGLDDEFRPTP